MKKLFKTHITLIAVFALLAIFVLIMQGCEQTTDEIIQSAQNVTPVSSDFTFIGLTATADGNPIIVNIMPKTGKSKGSITVYYEGTYGTVYSKSVIAPSAAGKYAVTFDVDAAEGFNAAKGLKAGTLTISAKTADIIEEDDEDDDNEEIIEEPINKPSEKPPEVTTEEPAEKPVEENNEEIIEETPEPFILVDFENSVWNGKGYAKRMVKWNGYEWAVSGVAITTDVNDRKTGDRSIRLRGSAGDTGDNTNRIELMEYLKDGIESISFDYASYSGNKGGTIILYYQKETGREWEEAGRVSNIPSWANAGSQMQNVKFDINITEKIRFKIEKSDAKSNSSVNIDNILITY